MVITICQSLLCASLLFSPLDDGPAAEVRYNGTLTAARGLDDAPDKRFEVYCLIMNGQAESRRLAFLVTETGGGAWPWPERFGVIELDRSNKATGGEEIRLLHTHDGVPSPVTIRQPLFEFADKLEADAAWTAGKHAYEVLRTRKVKDRDCWVVEVTTNFGYAQTLFVEQQSHLIVAAEQRVFLGRGDRFTLTFELESAKPIDAAALARLEPTVKTLAKVKADLKRTQSQQTKPVLSDDQLKAAAGVIEQLTVEADKTPFERYVTAIRRDVASQQQRVDDVAGLAKKFVGMKSPKLTLQTLEGKTVEPEDHQGKIVVLHFWEYQAEPLEEPYGQVGYLDFLNNRNQKRKLDVPIYGVAVDERLADATKRSAALRSVRELKKFFNLGYTVTVDDGTLLGRFGDPRRLDAKLPLWVVIDADGKIAHYSTGFYDIKPDEGLKQLETVIVELIKKQRSGEE